MDIETYAILKKKIEESIGNGISPSVLQRIENLEHDKVDLATYATGQAGLVQQDAITILQNPETYEGKIIQFYSNTTAPAHLISYGVIIRGTDTAHTPYLIELDRDGHTVKWTEETNYNANEGITFREIK